MGPQQPLPHLTPYPRDGVRDHDHDHGHDRGHVLPQSSILQRSWLPYDECPPSSIHATGQSCRRPLWLQQIKMGNMQCKRKGCQTPTGQTLVEQFTLLLLDSGLNLGISAGGRPRTARQIGFIATQHPTDFGLHAPIFEVETANLVARHDRCRGRLPTLPQRPTCRLLTTKQATVIVCTIVFCRLIMVCLANVQCFHLPFLQLSVAATAPTFQCCVNQEGYRP
jgi:hypothetical protein